MPTSAAPFRDRVDAGRKLGERLEHLRAEAPVVLGLARGGVIVAAEIASELNAPLDVIIARKLGAPQQPELGIGAVAPGGVKVVDGLLTARLGIPEAEVARIAEREQAEIERREQLYRHAPPINLAGRTVILVDDGLATGVTALAAARSVRRQNPKRLVLAFPVCTEQGAELLADEADELIAYTMPNDLKAVGFWYEDFTQTEDGDVVKALENSGTAFRPPKFQESLRSADAPIGVKMREVQINVGEAILTGDLLIPEGAKGVVLFAHGSGSGRLSPRNRFVAQKLNEHMIATLLVDLLTVAEEEEDRYSGHLRFDIGMLGDRLHRVTRWLEIDLDTRSMRIGYFGASTGAAAALVASIRNPMSVRAIVSRGGRPDLAGSALSNVTAPTLLIVGDLDTEVLPLNEDALGQIGSGMKKLEVVNGARHLFEEPGALEQVAALAQRWFSEHLA